MKALDRWLFNGCAFGISATGLILLITRYFMRNDDPFSLVNHPLEPVSLKLHILFAPAFCIVAGVVFNGHVRRKLASDESGNRISGILAFGSGIAMVFSGAALQLVTGDNLRAGLFWIHLSAGALFVGSFVAHLFKAWRKRQIDASASREIERVAA